MNRIQIISHDPLICKLFKSATEEFPVQMICVPDLEQGLKNLSKGLCDAIVVNIPLITEPCPRKIFREIQKVNPYVPVFFLMNQLDYSEAIALTKLGVEYCYNRPFAVEAVIENVQITLQNLVAPVLTQMEAPKHQKYLEAVSKQARDMYRQIDTVADTRFKVIIYGETGTGKESVARRLSEGVFKNRPFVAVDCGCLSKELAASELFGHKKGSFSGAFEDKKGAFEEAHTGTLFLDEIGNLDYSVQVLLLRAIEERKTKRVGSNKEVDNDVRIITASNERLSVAVANGSFREDLYYRLNEFEINIPPLRDRMDDLEPFIDFFIGDANKDLGKEIQGVDQPLLDKFHNYQWPGNIRELKNVIRRGCLMATSLITAACMSHEFMAKLDSEFSKLDLSEVTEKVTVVSEDLKHKSILAEYEEILKVMKEENYSKTKTAKRLKINRKTLYNKLTAYSRLVEGKG